MPERSGSMADSAREQGELTPAEPPSPTRKPVAGLLRRVLFILLAGMGLAWIGWLLVEREAVQGAWTIQVVLALMTFVAGLWGEVHRYRTWTVPARQLGELLLQVRGG